jgi:double-stranded uracil-DNA glycosylase
MPIAPISSRGASASPTSCGGPPRASELSREELCEGGARLQRFVAEHRPAVVAIAGVTAYRDAFGERGAVPGRQPDTLDSSIHWSGAGLWVVPNPSGLNAHETVATLAAAYAAPAAEAGVIAR